MKTTILVSALLMSASILTAQTANKPATVRIKKIENINGVEKITDTTFVTNDPHSIQLENGTINIIGDDHEGQIIKKVIIDDGNGEVITENIEGGQPGDGKMVKKIIIDDGNGEVTTEELSKEIDAEVEKALKEAGVEGDAKKGKQVVIVNHDVKKDGSKNEKQMTKIIITKKVDIKDADEADMKRLGNTADGELKIDNMNFYPNPNTGKFNLSFSLPEKGDAEITILSTEGKKVYTEKLANFSGSY